MSLSSYVICNQPQTARMLPHQLSVDCSVPSQECSLCFSCTCVTHKKIVMLISTRLLKSTVLFKTVDFNVTVERALRFHSGRTCMCCFCSLVEIDSFITLSKPLINTITQRHLCPAGQGVIRDRLHNSCLLPQDLCRVCRWCQCITAPIYQAPFNLTQVLLGWKCLYITFK